MSHFSIYICYTYIENYLEEFCHAEITENIHHSDYLTGFSNRDSLLANQLSGTNQYLPEIGSTAALQNGEEISLQNPVIWHENEPYVPINEVVSRLGGSIDEKTFTIQQNTVTVVGLLQDNVVYTPITYLQEKYMMAAKWDKERNRVILTVAPDEIPLTRRWLFWRHKTVRGLRVGDSEERYLDLYGSPSVRDGIIDDLLHVEVENGVVTAIVMGHYD